MIRLLFPIWKIWDRWYWRVTIPWVIPYILTKARAEWLGTESRSPRCVERRQPFKHDLLSMLLPPAPLTSLQFRIGRKLEWGVEPRPEVRHSSMEYSHLIGHLNLYAKWTWVHFNLCLLLLAYAVKVVWFKLQFCDSRKFLWLKWNGRQSAMLIFFCLLLAVI